MQRMVCLFTSQLVFYRIALLGGRDECVRTTCLELKCTQLEIKPAICSRNQWTVKPYIVNLLHLLQEERGRITVVQD